MSRPDFDKMSRSELKAYVLQHRTDDEAVRALFDRRSPDETATWYTFSPFTQEKIQEMDAVFRQKIQEQKTKDDQKH